MPNFDTKVRKNFRKTRSVITYNGNIYASHNGIMWKYDESSNSWYRSMLPKGLIQSGDSLYVEGTEIKVDIYRNLHKKCWSVRSREPGPLYGRVIEHMKEGVLFDCRFTVGEKGRLKVVNTRRKNVHAFVRGKLIYGKKLDLALASLGEVSYNPYKSGHFYTRGDGKFIHKAKMVRFLKDKVVAYA